MQLSDKEKLILALALDPAVQAGEMVSAATKLIESWRRRDVHVEDFEMEQILVPARKERKFWRPDYGLSKMPWGRHKGEMFKDIAPQYLRNQMLWIRGAPDRALKFAEIIEMFLAQ
jgi:hypothetical protein